MEEKNWSKQSQGMYASGQRAIQSYERWETWERVRRKEKAGRLGIMTNNKSKRVKSVKWIFASLNVWRNYFKMSFLPVFSLTVIYKIDIDSGIMNLSNPGECLKS